MRVTNKMMSNNFLRDLNFNLNNMQKLQTQLTSGKEFKRPSDNPFKVARSMQLYTDINANKQYNENISDSINWLDTTDTAVGQVNNVFQRIHELMISAGNGGYSKSERASIKDEINERISEISQIMNTTFDGKYIFGGSRGTVKPTEVNGGMKYEGAPTVKVNDFKKWEGKTITFTHGSESVNVKMPDKITSEEQIVAAMNTEFNKAGNESLKLEAKYNITEKSIMFVSGNDNPINVTTDKEIADIKDKLTTIEKTNIVDNGNSSLKYFSKDGEVTETQKDMISNKLYIEVSTGVVIGYNVTATDLMEFNDKDGNAVSMMHTLSAIVNHIDGRSADGGEPIGEDQIDKLLKEDLSAVKAILENISKVRSKVGAMQNRMDSAKKRNEEENFNMKEILSKTEDIDIAEKTMEYATMQTVYMASLQTSAKVIQPSLMDYVR